jgi:hypothetical protein
MRKNRNGVGGESEALNAQLKKVTKAFKPMQSFINMAIPKKAIVPSAASQASAKKLSDIGSAWNALSDPQQELWNRQAALNTVTTDAGEIREISGYALFSAVNSNKQLLNPQAAVVSVPPANLFAPVLPIPQIVGYAYDDSNSIDIRGTDYPGAILFYATKGLSKNVKEVSNKSSYKFIGAQLGGLDPSDNRMNTPFNFLTGQRVGIMVVALNTAGLRMSSSEVLCTVAPSINGGAG